MQDAPTDLQLLAIEARFYRHAGSKMNDVRAELGLGMTRYAQLLNAAINNPSEEAMRRYPTVILRLRRHRDRVVAQKAPHTTRRSA
jgi:hypothetical protein